MYEPIQRRSGYRRFLAPFLSSLGSIDLRALAASGKRFEHLGTLATRYGFTPPPIALDGPAGARVIKIDPSFAKAAKEISPTR
jgi:hypothetical protein